MARRWFDYIQRDEIETDGINQAWLVTTQSLGHEGSSPDDDSPHRIANEWIACNLAWHLRLPVPPFALMRRPGGKGMFVSLHYDPRHDSQPDDNDPSALVAADASLATGVILLDILIANIDRHRGNIKCVNPDDPDDVWLIDHERAVFGHMPGEIRKRLDALWDALGITGKESPEANRHCLLDHLATGQFMPTWTRRVQCIPDEFIIDICNETIGIGVTQEQAEWQCEFLIHRKRELIRIIRAGGQEFTRIKKSQWALLA